MQPGPITTAFPKIEAKVRAERPLLADSILDIIVTDISDNVIQGMIPHANRTAYDNLNTPTGRAYLDSIANWAFDGDRGNGFDLRYEVEPGMLPPIIPVKQPPEPAPAARRQNKLDLTQHLALAEWVREHREEVTLESDSKLAHMATAALEFTVTVPNITSTRLALKIDKVRPAAPPTLEERFTALEERFTALETLVKTLAAE